MRQKPLTKEINQNRIENLSNQIKLILTQITSNGYQSNIKKNRVYANYH